MGRLKNLDRTLLDSRLDILEEAGWRQSDIEMIDPHRAERLLRNLRLGTTPEHLRGMDTETQLRRQRMICEDYYGIEIDAKKLKLPRRPRGYDRLLVTATDDIGRIFHACKGVFRHEIVRGGYWIETTSVRTCRRGPYAVWTKDCRDADPRNAGRPADDFAQSACMTLPERLHFELTYFLEFDEHLDKEMFTICGGSRAPRQHIPLVFRIVANRDESLPIVHIAFEMENTHSTNAAVRLVKAA